MRMSVGLDAEELKAGLEGVMPWLTPTGLAAEALALLDRPLMCWTQHEYGLFDSAAHYADYEDEPGGLSRLEKKIAKLAPRPQWAMERVWTPDEETDEAYDAAYAKDSVTLGGRRLHPRDLDAYTTTAYELAALADEDDDFDPNDLEDEADLVGGTWTRPCPGLRRACASCSSPSRTRSATFCCPATPTAGPGTAWCSPTPRCSA
ncbi:hypothetical protein GCM10010329_84790 [Streptomyces spiroverticillatus]|uniref:Uncharacterized protein n=1 Tax=Streptomyces finlayi TaxID=67296 RepID=A0A919CGC1_9ACTN|nr:hypothetical protein [Streptomyces finlayi]GHA49629.1 hypothetical protein GCM10010329_84790 [Streptomyces spiroverticillatus]GHD19426.1 hypothetical protein GCM10010334_83100 [Streptomyces finlayi]